MIDIERLLADIERIPIDENRERPRVTLSYTQSLNGSLTRGRGQRIQLNGEESLRLHRQLRIHHDAILVGIGTVLADDPQLSLRFAEGANPQPVILDSELRLPLDAKLLQTERKPWIFTNDRADIKRKEALQKKGAYVLRAKASEDNQVDLHYMLRELKYLGIKCLIVEGGAKIIESFISKKLIDAFVIFISPVSSEGRHPIEIPLTVGSQEKLNCQTLPGMGIIGRERCDRDLVVWGHFFA